MLQWLVVKEQDFGHNGPKGTFIFDPENNKSLFEALCDTLIRAWKEYGTVVYWYIMTSRENNDATVAFFEAHNYFGYPKEKVKFFKQDELPMIDMNGNILLDEKGFVKEAANGHGGTLQSLEKAHIIDDMKEKGIEWVFINGVDNALVKPVDPLLMGMSISHKVLGAVKSFEKTDPKEKVGVFCRKNKKVGVVEYTEISEEMANRRDDYGSLVFGDANGIFHLYNIKGLEKVAEVKLPYHIAVKKANYIDKDGNLVKAEKPNAYKFEMFIFDSYDVFEDVVVLRVKREEEYLDFSKSSLELFNQIRGLSPFPGSSCVIDDKEFKVYFARISSVVSSSFQPGQILHIYKDGIGIATKDYEIVLLDIKPFGKKRMLASSFINGIKKEEYIGKVVYGRK